MSVVDDEVSGNPDRSGHDPPGRHCLMNDRLIETRPWSSVRHTENMALRQAADLADRLRPRRLGIIDRQGLEALSLLAAGQGMGSRPLRSISHFG